MSYKPRKRHWEGWQLFAYDFCAVSSRLIEAVMRIQHTKKKKPRSFILHESRLQVITKALRSFVFYSNFLSTAQFLEFLNRSTFISCHSIGFLKAQFIVIFRELCQICKYRFWKHLYRTSGFYVQLACQK